MATIKQKRVIEKMSENVRSGGELLRKAGYAPSTAEKPGRTLAGQGIQDLIAKGESIGLSDEKCLQTVLDAVESNQLSNALNAVKYWFSLKYPESKESQTVIGQQNIQINYTRDQELQACYEELAKEHNLSVEEVRGRLNEQR